MLHTQTRVGLRGRPFRFYKFRSMHQAAQEGDDDVHKEYVCAYINGDDTTDLAAVQTSDAPFKIADHPRITRVGAVLRKYSLDELPQFWNVLVGDMSLVGPRPALPYEVERYQDWHRRRLDLAARALGPLAGHRAQPRRLRRDGARGRAVR